MKNLFDFATKELSQDAFICWLVSNYDNNNNTKLKEIAYEYINFLADSNYNYRTNDIKHLNILQQANNMDIIIDIWENELPQEEYKNTSTSDFVIVIEDKADSSAHNEQLLKYGEKIDKWKDKNNHTLKKHKKVFYKSNYLSSKDEEELKKYNNKNTENKWKIKWKIIDIDDIYNFFIKNENKDSNSEIFDSYVKYILNKHEELHNERLPSDDNLNKWLSFFRRTLSNNIKEEFAPVIWCDSNMYGYAYFCVRVKPYELEGGPYFEIRHRDCINGSFIARILTYGMDDEPSHYKDNSKEIKAKIRDEIRNGDYKNFVANGERNDKQLARTYLDEKIVGEDEFIKKVKECVEEFKLIMENA